MTRRVVCNETGEVFKSQTEVTKWLGCSSGIISNHVLYRMPGNINGYTFDMVDSNERYVWDDRIKDWYLEEKT